MGNIEKSSFQQESNAGPPPPYTNAAAGSSSGQRQITRQFPPEFGLYSHSFSSKMHIGEHQDHPLYAVVIHSGLSGNPPVVLHGGPDNSYPMMAAVNFHAFSSRMTITLPPLSGRSSVGSKEEVNTKHVHLRTHYVFSVEVGADAQRRETFEWRHSSGDAVSAVGGDHSGWKLMRMESVPPPGVSGGQFVPGGFSGSDGKEAVAAWSNTSLRGHKTAKFAFMGTGASGLLGERWEIMAVITALGIHEKERRAKQSAAAAG